MKGEKSCEGRERILWPHDPKLRHDYARCMHSIHTEGVIAVRLLEERDVARYTNLANAIL